MCKQEIMNAVCWVMERQGSVNNRAGNPDVGERGNGEKLEIRKQADLTLTVH